MELSIGVAVFKGRVGILTGSYHIAISAIYSSLLEHLLLSALEGVLNVVFS